MKTLKFFTSVLTLFILLVIGTASHAEPGYAIKPDLRVSQISTPGGLKKGRCSKVRVTVTNPSMGAAKGNIPVILYISQSGYPPKSYVGYIQGGLGPNSNYGKSVWFNNVEIASTGTVTLKAFVNPDHQIQESVYSNNTKIVKATVKYVCGQSTTPPQGATLTVTAYKDGQWNYGNYAPVSQAKVKIVKNGQTYIKYTGSNGKATFSNIPTGMLSITVTKYGYQAATKQFMMSSYDNNTNVAMIHH
ncbi:MAG: hypothetical protein KDC80_29575 [Saprospiraceae bacterium]|nr:hypothetical protein [Saprospiraceae bacterium]